MPRQHAHSRHARITSTSSLKRAKGKEKEKEQTTSLLSSVFSFVSREIDSFVSTATGRVPEDEFEEEEDDDEEEEDGPRASSSRSQPEMREVSKDTTRVVHRLPREGKTNGRKTSRVNLRSPGLASHRFARNARHDQYASSSEDEGNKGTKRIASSPLTPRPARRQPAHPDDEEEGLSGSDRSLTPVPSPSPARIRRKRSAFTMPGALYDRTSSLEPTPEPDFERTRVVRFASEVSVSPSRRLSETPRPAHQIEEMEAGPSSGRRQSSNPEQRAQDLFPAEESSENEEGPSSSPTKRPSRGMGRFVQEAVRQRSADKNPDVSLLLPQSPAPATWSSPNKGKGKAPVLPEAEVINVDDSEEESSSEDEHNRSSRADISVTTRVKGKERELHTARRQERESRSLANDDERTRDKERIRILEEELRKLREELARRPVVTQSNIAPPPPPPPPPPVFSRPQTMNQQEQTFADVRASLRHAGTPVEKPINPAAYGGPSVRKGQPTIVGADMMAAFLTEMKTHRLRKIGNADETSTMPSSSSRSQPAVRVREVGDVGNRSEVVLRPREIEDVGNRSEMLPRPERSFAFAGPSRQVRRAESTREVGESADPGRDVPVGSKRKQPGASEAAEDPLPSKRRALSSSVHARETSSVSSIRPPSSSTKNTRLPNPTDIASRTAPVSNSSQSSGPSMDATSRLHHLAEVRIGMGTPSLCSDNEQDSGRSNEDRSPPTPPPSASEHRENTSTGDVIHERVILPDIHNDAGEVEEIGMERYRSEQQQRKSQPARRVLEASQMDDSFTRRQPVSRKLDSPRRPRAPARARMVKEVSQHEEGDDEDMDPISLSFASAEPSSYIQVDEQEEQVQDVRQADAPESPPLRLPLRPPPGMFKPAIQKAVRPTRLPVHKGLQKGRSKSTVRSSSNNASSGTASLRRRDSLDSELRRAEATYDAEVLDDDEPDTFSGLGTRSRKRGFIAFGGAGGPSAVMGEGSVEGLEDVDVDDSSSDEEIPEVVPVSRIARRLSARTG